MSTKLLILIIAAIMIPLTAHGATLEDISDTQAAVQTTMSYGITREILEKALDYYEATCSLEDINNIRRNLGLPLVDSCVIL